MPFGEGEGSVFLDNKHGATASLNFMWGDRRPLEMFMPTLLGFAVGTLTLLSFCGAISKLLYTCGGLLGVSYEGESPLVIRELKGEPSPLEAEASIAGEKLLVDDELESIKLLVLSWVGLTILPPGILCHV